MTVLDLQFVPFVPKVASVHAAKVTEEFSLHTVDGATVAHAGDYVVQAGEVEKEHFGPHEAPDGTLTYERVKVTEPTFAVIDGPDFEALYHPAS